MRKFLTVKQSTRTDKTDKLLDEFINVVNHQVEHGNIDDDIIKRFTELIQDTKKLKYALFFL